MALDFWLQTRFGKLFMHSLHHLHIILFLVKHVAPQWLVLYGPVVNKMCRSVWTAPILETKAGSDISRHVTCSSAPNTSRDTSSWLRRRLNYRLNNACEADIDTLCAEECSPFLGSACGGRVLRCLTEKQDAIKSKECADEVCHLTSCTSRKAPPC